MKKLYRCEAGKIISGLLGGIGNYFNIDSSIIRLGYVFLTIFSGCFPGLLFYIIGSIIVPKEGIDSKRNV